MTTTFPPAPVTAALRVLEAAGYEAYLVGGCVRDHLLARPVHDFDIATDARPEEVTGLFERVIPTGVRHGTVTVLMDEMPLEITTYRIDIGYTDRRRPDRVEYTRHLEADLARRDFTINAIAIDVRKRVVDPFDGRADLTSRLVRTVGEPLERFAEDALRIVRALRFSAQLDFTIDTWTKRAMESSARGLAAVSTERIGHELWHMAAANWWKVAGDLANGPYLDQLPGPLPQLRDAFAHLAARSTAAASWLQVGHALPSDTDRAVASIALWMLASRLPIEEWRAIRELLAWPKAVLARATDLAAMICADPARWSPHEWRTALFESGEPLVRAAAMVADWWYGEDRGGGRLHMLGTYTSTQPLWHPRELKLSGRDLVAAGITGPAVGRIKRQLIDDVLAQRCPNDRAALLQRGREYFQQP